MEPIRKVSSKLCHEFSICGIQLLFEWLEDLRGAQELPFDDLRMLGGSWSNLALKAARARQDTLCEFLVNEPERS